MTSLISFKLLGWGIIGGILMNTSYNNQNNLSPSSTNAPLFIRPMAQPSAQKGPLVVSKIGSRVLKPPLVFPRGSFISGLELEGDASSGSFIYFVSSGASWPQTYAFYQHYYAKAHVRWLGKQHSGALTFYAFFLYPDNGVRKNAITVMIYPHAHPKDPDESKLGLTLLEQKRPRILATGNYSGKEVEKGSWQIPVTKP